ncbi:MAG: ATP-binding protein [Bacteroidia bacterium]|nr:ATP-binding protein [Bacteroidia bacterium]
MKNNKTTVRKMKIETSEIKPADSEKDGLKGPVKQVMQTCYKAHRAGGIIAQGKIEVEHSLRPKNFFTLYNDKGTKIKKQVFSKGDCTTKLFNDKGQHVEDVRENKLDVLKSRMTIGYDDAGNQNDITIFDGDGNVRTHSVYQYDELNRPFENISYKDDGSISEKTIWKYYKDQPNIISCITYEAGGNIKRQTLCKYNEQGKQIETVTEYAEERMKDYCTRTTMQYNSHGDCVLTNVFKQDGTLKKSYPQSYEYDSEGEKIIPYQPPYDPDAKAAGETEELENDARGNWIKKTTFFNKVPVNIFVREINYFDEPEKKFVHPLTLETAEVVEKDNTIEPMEMEDAKWLVESPQSTPENFSALRYYALHFKEAPSVIVYSGPNIEVFTLRDELLENLYAQEIHSYSTVWNMNKQIRSFTIDFKTNHGYLLHVSGISSQDEDEFEVPGNIDPSHSGYIYFGQIQLLRPSDASGKRDEYFEQELNEYIDKCSLRKKPDKPTIHMIETTTNGFIMREHPVDDNFEIRDLDLNYGSGFQKFHDDLMQRFHNSTKGLVLFHGEPGTGKTYYIRHLLRKMVSHNRKAVIYMPPNMVDHLVDPVFMTFLTAQVQDWSEDGFFSVLLIEDAEPLLAKRVEGIRIQGVTNLLNMSDGLLNDMLNLQIICTFNVDVRKLDSALLRPGRLIARKEFKALHELDANILASRLGIKHHFKGPATLGEIYAMRKNQNTLIHDVEQDKGSSTTIDDLI